MNDTLLTVATPPHWHSRRTVRGMMLENILALLPAAAVAVGWFGLPALRVMALSCAVCVILETACEKLMHRVVTVDELSPLVTGLTIAFLLPAGVPWWLVVMAAASTTLLGKMIFGGLGQNPLPPAAVGWTVCVLSWPSAMNVDVAMLNSPLSYPLSRLKQLGPEAVADYGPWELLLGQQLGGLGASMVLAVLAGGVYLLVRRRLRWEVPLAFLIGAWTTAAIFHAADPAAYAPAWFHLLTGSLVFGAFFLAADPGASPNGRLPMVLYGLAGGALVIVIRAYGIYPDGTPFAVLLGALLTPLLDTIRPRPLGRPRRRQ
jgi:electron transport complex protein RnfD